MKSTILATALGISIAGALVLFLSEYVTYIFFYSIVFHNMRQGLGITLIYRHKASTKGISTSWFKKMYYFLVLVPFVVFHFRASINNLGWLQKYFFNIPLQKWLPVIYFPSIIYISTVLYLIFFIGSLLYFLRTEDWRSVLSLYFFAAIYSFAYLFSNNLLYSTFLLITSHAIPYLFLVQYRSKLFHKNDTVRAFSTSFIIMVLFLGFIYYTFFYTKVGEISLLTNWQKFFIILPSYIHYSIDGHVWKKGYVRFTKFLQT